MDTERNGMLRSRITAIVLAALLLYVGGEQAWSQEKGAASPLVLITESLPRSTVQRSYHFQMEARGGRAPLQWSVTSGGLPPGMALEQDAGLITGTATALGEFHVVLRLADSAQPTQTLEREFTLRVVAPLLAEWKKPAVVNRNHIEGSVMVSNGSEDDFDLTVIVVAVNEIGKAFALGYEHFVVKKDRADLEIPFGSSLPHGSYEVHVDTVAEVEAKQEIRRARLVSPQRLPITVGP